MAFSNNMTIAAHVDRLSGSPGIRFHFGFASDLPAGVGKRAAIADRRRDLSSLFLA